MPGRTAVLIAVAVLGAAEWRRGGQGGGAPARRLHGAAGPARPRRADPSGRAREPPLPARRYGGAALASAGGPARPATQCHPPPG